MIRLIFCDVGRMSAESTLNIYEKTPALAGVVPSFGTKGSLNSVRGYIALLALTSELFSRGECAEICKGNADLSIIREEYGKPRFASFPLCFNISKRGDALAVALSDEGEVGVDLEELIDEGRAAGIEARFLKSFHPESEGPPDVKLIYASFFPDGKISEIEILECSPEQIDTKFSEKTEICAEYDNNDLHITRISPSYDTTARWTALEAVIKLSGGGFADFPRASLLASECGISSFALTYRGSEYRISLAIPKRGK